MYGWIDRRIDRKMYVLIDRLKDILINNLVDIDR